MGIIYGGFSPDGELRYIGQTRRSLDQRVMQHLLPSSLKKPGHKNNWIKSLLQHGQRPYWSVIQALENDSDLDDAERYWIRFFREQDCRILNETSGGDGLRDPSIETRQRMSMAKQGRCSNRFGTHMSNSTKEKLHAINSGKHITPETRQRMSLSHCQTIVDSKGTIYSSVREAATKLGISASSISNVLAGRRRSARGFSFRRMSETILK